MCKHDRACTRRRPRWQHHRRRAWSGWSGWFRQAGRTVGGDEKRSEMVIMGQSLCTKNFLEENIYRARRERRRRRAMTEDGGRRTETRTIGADGHDGHDGLI